MPHDFDVIVAGSGLAGSTLALQLASTMRVALITKDRLGESNSKYAQGGIAAVLADATDGDSFEAHVQDTMNAGDGLCKEEIVRQVASAAPQVVKYLEDCGVQFSRMEDGSYSKGREGGHSQRRVLHAGDITGHQIQTLLVRRIRESSIEVFEEHMLVDLILSERVRNGEPNGIRGMYVLTPDGRIIILAATIVVLATGGAGKVYLYTSNPDGATGDGLAVGARAGLQIANLEFYQFHPTCLYEPRAKNFLISEAVRGEGARIVDSHGRSIMDGVHPMSDLAPRDVVARQIDRHMTLSGDDCVYLDVTHKSKTWLKNRFPNLYETCAKFGYDMSKHPLPVVPAAHYQCGGLVANLDGSTTRKGLYAIGEVACTGLHGANRLASNSLLEAIVQAHKCAYTICKKKPAKIADVACIPKWENVEQLSPGEKVLIRHLWDEIRMLMSHYVGIYRSEDRLKKALRRIRTVNEEVQSLYWAFQPDRNLIELRNIGLIAEVLIRSAAFRKESRGLQQLHGYPPDKKRRQKWAGDTIVDPINMEISFRQL